MIKICNKSIWRKYYFKNKISFSDVLCLTEFFQYSGSLICTLFFKKREFYTLKTDLQLSEDEIFSSFRKKVRYEVRRSSKDGLSIFHTNDFSIDDFVDFYNVFAKDKNINQIKSSELKGLRDYLHLVYITEPESSKPTIQRLFIIDKEDKRVRFMYEASCPSDEILDKNLHGRASKLLHWETIKHFKVEGYKVYDWGGIALNDDPLTLGIDNFKRSFGGVQDKEYHLLSYPYITLRFFKRSFFLLLTFLKIKHSR